MENASTLADMKKRILVVDDNPDAADGLGMLIGMQGYEVQTAHDGLEAVAAAAAFRPNILLLDIGMPRMNGYEAACRIREQEGGPEIILIAVTGWEDERNRLLCDKAGFDYHMTKPVKLDALRKLLDACSVNPKRPCQP